MQHFESINQYPLITVQTGMMLTEALSKNPSLTGRLAELGYPDQNKFQIHYQMYKWYNALFKLAPAQQAKYDKLLKRAKPYKNTFLICAQIRMGGSTPANNFEPKMSALDSRDKFFKFINRTFISNMSAYTDTPTNYRVFLTADVNSYNHEAADFFGPQKVV